MSSCQHTLGKKVEDMESQHQSRWKAIAKVLRFGFWAVLLLLVLWQFWKPAQLDANRADLVRRFQEQRKSRVIALIHGEDTINFFGVPVGSFINMEDSESILRAIRLTPPDQPIDFIPHTPGGLVLAAEQIAHALVEHKGKVTVFVPHYAMSGGTLIALTADEIVMDPNAVLGSVDPQIGDMPAASIVKLLKQKPRTQISDEMLVLIDVAGKARLQVAAFLSEVLLKHLPKADAVRLAVALSEGRWTHDFPITVEGARQLGLSVSTQMPTIIYELMDLYPQSGIGRPSVLYVPFRKSTLNNSQDGPGPDQERKS
jgi:ClpP class serine protease